MRTCREPVGEARRREGLAVFGHEEGEVFTRRRCRIPVAWGELGRRPPFPFFLTYCEHAITDVLTAHPNHVAAALTRVEQERQREPRLRSYLVLGLELGNVVLAPGLEALRLGSDSLDPLTGLSLRQPLSMARRISTRRSFRNLFAEPGVAALASTIAVLATK